MNKAQAAKNSLKFIQIMAISGMLASAVSADKIPISLKSSGTTNLITNHYSAEDDYSENNTITKNISLALNHSDKKKNASVIKQVLNFNSQQQSVNSINTGIVNASNIKGTNTNTAYANSKKLNSMLQNKNALNGDKYISKNAYKQKNENRNSTGSRQSQTGYTEETTNNRNSNKLGFNGFNDEINDISNINNQFGIINNLKSNFDEISLNNGFENIEQEIKYELVLNTSILPISKNEKSILILRSLHLLVKPILPIDSQYTNSAMKSNQFNTIFLNNTNTHIIEKVTNKYQTQHNEASFFNLNTLGIEKSTFTNALFLMAIFDMVISILILFLIISIQIKLTKSVAISLSKATVNNYSALNKHRIDVAVILKSTDACKLIMGGLPEGYHITPLDIPSGTKRLCTLTGPLSTNATFVAIGISLRRILSIP